MNSRRKGKTGELEACKAIAQHWGTMPIRTAQVSGKFSADIMNALPDTHIEVKRHAKIAALKFLRQAERDTKGETPVVVMRENGETEWVVMLRLSDTPQFARNLYDTLNTISEVK